MILAQYGTGDMRGPERGGPGSGVWRAVSPCEAQDGPSAP